MAKNSKNKAIGKAKKGIHEAEGGSRCNYCSGKHQSSEHYLTTKPYTRGEGKSGMRSGHGGIMKYEV